MTTGVRPARKEAAGRRRRAAQFSAARQLARTRPSDDPAHGSSSGSSSGSDSSSGSSPSVGLSGADDDAEEDDVDTNYSKKTIKELREVLTTRGIPFNKGDKKTDLLSLLAATS